VHDGYPEWLTPDCAPYSSLFGFIGGAFRCSNGVHRQSYASDPCQHANLRSLIRLACPIRNRHPRQARLQRAQHVLQFGELAGAVAFGNGGVDRITASRARNSDIGNEREKSRMGTRRDGAAAGLEPLGDRFRAIVNRPSSAPEVLPCSKGQIRFALVLRIGEGRDLATRKNAGEHIFRALCDHLDPVFAQCKFALSFDMQINDKETSWKRNNIHEASKVEAAHG
jgi:5-carboxymethyl-2-hydroxymuconate isomerase